MIPRRATIADLGALVQVINRAYIVEAPIFFGERTDERDVRAKLALPNACFLAIDDADREARAGRLAGAVYVEVRGDRGYFGMLSVDPDRQGRGLGKVLVRAAEASCGAAGCRFMDIDVVDRRLELPGFYESLGYTVVGTKPYHDPSHLRPGQRASMIVMSRPLADE